MTHEGKVSLMGQQCVPRARGWTEPESSWKELLVARAWGGTMDWLLVVFIMITITV